MSKRIRVALLVGILPSVSFLSPAHAQTPGLVAAYSFDEGSGATAADFSGNSNTGTLRNGAAWTAAGKHGSALLFDGVDDWVSVADAGSLDLTSRMTLEAWVYPTATQASWRTVLHKERDIYYLYASSSAGPLIPAGGGNIGGVGSAKAAVAIPVNAWSHLAVTYDGSALTLYVNGAQVSSIGRTGNLSVSANPLGIGGNSAFGEYFKGRIDDARIYNRALSASEIQGDLNAPVQPADSTPPTAPEDLSATGSVGAISLAWSAASDNVSVVVYNVHAEAAGGFTPGPQNRIAQVTGTSHVDSGVEGTHYYRVTAQDAAGNIGPPSNEASATALEDTTPPGVSISSPASGETVSGVITIAAGASDDVAVERVEFLVDGAVLGNDTTAPYGIAWNTKTVENGPPTVSARAWDTSGNSNTHSITVNVDNAPVVLPFSGPLRVSGSNPRYFTDDTGKAILLSGSHTWSNLVDNGGSNPPPAFDYAQYLDFLDGHNHNFFRMWAWENSRWSVQTADDNYWWGPMIYERTGPGNSLDGLPRFDLTRFHQGYFDRLRERVIEAGERGIYVSIMLFNGWAVEHPKGGFASNNPWKGHPFNASNNVNGINGDLNGDNSGGEIHTLASAGVRALQEAYVRKVIDTVNDLDNVLYEISNESHSGSQAWQYHMINFIKSHEATLPSRHPVGMTVEWPSGSNAELFSSPADWISPNGGLTGGPVANGSKVVLLDTDHLCGICGNRDWAWRAFVNGNNPVFMDGYDGAAYGAGAGQGYNPGDPAWPPLRASLGYILGYANKMDLVRMAPRGDLFSSGLGLANPAAAGAEYLGYLPSGGSVSVNLGSSQGELSIEWFSPVSGVTAAGGKVNGGATRTFGSPFSGASVLYLKSVPVVPDTSPPTAPGSLSAMGSYGSIGLAWGEAEDDVGVVLYNVHAEGTSGFQPGPANRIAQVSGTSHVDTGVEGTFYYRVTAQDAAGNIGPASNEASATALEDTTAPVVSIGSPLSGETVSSVITIITTASDDVAVLSVEFLVDGVILGNDTTAPYGLSWDTRTAANGAHVLKAVAADTSGNTGMHSISVNVQNSPQPQGLVASYNFDEGSGATAADASGNSNTGTLRNGAAWIAAGKHGSALLFDGVNDWVSVADAGSLDLTSRMTLEAWVYPTAAQASWRTVLHKERDIYYLYASSSAGPLFPAGGGNIGGVGSAKASVAIPVNAWSHLAVTYNGTALTLYVNGSQVSSIGSTGNLSVSANPLGIGGNSAFGEYFKGRIDEARIYNRALTAAEIQADMNRF